MKSYLKKLTFALFLSIVPIIALAQPNESLPYGNPYPLQTLYANIANPQSVAFSPDGRTLASGTNMKNVKIWSLL